MNPDLLSSLISAGSGLVGAVIGVVGALIATRRASRTAFAQVRYGIQHERISEVLNTTYDRLGNVLSEAMRLIATRNRESMLERIQQYLKLSQEMYLYRLRNNLWIPVPITEKVRHIHDSIEDQVVKLSELLEDESLTDEQLEEEVNEIRQNLIHQVRGPFSELSRAIAKAIATEDVSSLRIPAFSPESLPEPDSSLPDT